MAAAQKPSIPDLEEVLARAQLHAQLSKTPDLVLDHRTAAFFLGVHCKKLERWRTERCPPHPVAMNAKDKSGVAVMYRVGELLAFIQQSQTRPEPKKADDPEKTHQVVGGKRVKPSDMPWVASATVEAETLEEPFFMTPDSLVLSHGWDEDVTTIAERLISGTSSIQWMPWDKALAAVWLDDRLRLAWLRHADTVAPGLRAAAEAHRHAALSKM